ncbi:PepSY-associated TM helix domain-containing protein [Derxia gummosa]|uniref:PepSY-associated TM helix domain-containing protein n=1 Tax=Derxia gummosa DSM 723 TaxID=1121388 RepID=A0A8B6X4U9_9BURK|nr:PepSY-associated TM helix domain-containing protein [Derxia gummosa]
MRTDYVRIYKSVHTWTGILSGMALFIAFYAGAFTVFKEPISRWASPPAVEAALPLADAGPLVVQTLAARPDAAREFTVHLREAEHLPGRLEWQLRAPGGDDHDERGARHYVATLDAGSARVSEFQPAPVAGFIDVLHRVIGLPVDSDPNRWVMGVIATLYALALFSGVVVLLPSLVKDLFALRVGPNLKRMWLDAHNAVGLMSLPFHVVMAVTAAVFAFHDGIYALQDRLFHDGRFGAAVQGPGVATPAATPPRDPATMLAPTELVARARELSPGFVPTQLQYQKVTGPKPVVRVWGRDEAAVSPRARGGFVALDPYSGKVMNADFLPGRQSAPNLVISSLFALHMAAFGGTAVQWMYFALGLAGAWLFYSGNLLWIESRRKRAPKQGGALPAQRRDARLMAAATIGVCLGCVCGISLTLLAAKWLHGRVADLHAWHVGLYYAAFLGAIGWAFARGAGRAAVHLLWLAAALAFAIPLTTLAGWLAPGLGLWAHGSAAALGVDLTALAGAGALALMARAAARRMRAGPPDSVWAARPATASPIDGATVPNAG